MDLAQLAAGSWLPPSMSGPRRVPSGKRERRRDPQGLCPVLFDQSQGRACPQPAPTAVPATLSLGRAAPPKRGCPPPISPPRPGLRLWAREFFSLQTPPNLQPAHLKDHLVSCSEAQAHARLEEDYADQKGEGDTRRLGLPETACRSRPLSPPCCATAVLTLSGTRPPEMISAWRGGSALRGRSEGCSGLG